MIRKNKGLQQQQLTLVVGPFVGVREGFCVGESEDGLRDGPLVGEVEGLPDGFAVGLLLGALEGLAVGISVGLIGLPVGALEGVDVGLPPVVASSQEPRAWHLLPFPLPGHSPSNAHGVSGSLVQNLQSSKVVQAVSLSALHTPLPAPPPPPPEGPCKEHVPEYVRLHLSPFPSGQSLLLVHGLPLLLEQKRQSESDKQLRPSGQE